ncbi:MAG: hypothetical protein N2441_09890 [Rhodocyclaceae bacterium]|nr:hypothetical protein [Rhodocyclaceae bacterium]
MKTVCAWLGVFFFAASAAYSGQTGASPWPPMPPHPYGWAERSAEEREAWRKERRKWHETWRELSAEEREALRQERRRLHEAWRELPPEERLRLRRDIQEAGDQLYPRRGAAPRQPLSE